MRYLIYFYMFSLFACSNDHDALKEKASSAAVTQDSTNAKFFCIKKYGAENCDDNGKKK